jgi:hypothetical protein
LLRGKTRVRSSPSAAGTVANMMRMRRSTSSVSVSSVVYLIRPLQLDTLR